MFKILLWLEEITSTQDFLKEKNLPLWSVVVANKQTKGRGRLGRVWYSQEGGLYFSFSLPQGIRNENTLPLVLSNAVADYLRSLGYIPAIKWVNDVYLQGKKVCGVLTERLKDRIVVGMGINLNQESFPRDIDAISLKIVSGKEHDKIGFLLGLLDYIESSIEKLSKDGFMVFKDIIEQRLLFKDSEVILYTPQPVVGILQGIDKDGSLLLITQDGIKAFQVGEITLRAL
jgi:BirA family biotin operon repressor/biotin-[acetyl-CoA-carboxylase] ligase